MGFGGLGVIFASKSSQVCNEKLKKGYWQKPKLGLVDATQSCG
ncbi:hypothetical protein ERO13_D10G207750v2 [Gossypium hirsutum]|nr:hypothetical protein ERO13_D10G207750v2 [Gossypium hirsutum]